MSLRCFALALIVTLVACGPKGTSTPVDGGTGGGGGGVGGGGGGGGGGAEDAGQTDGGEVTWYRDVLPIAQGRCHGCHVSGGIAPFSLETYADAFSYHALMANAVQARRMPPWMPADNCQSFVHSRRLTQGEIDVFTAWSTQGAPAGNPSDAPPAPDGGMGLPGVDATLTPATGYTPNASLTDDYRCLIVDPQLTQSRYVTGFEITPGVRRQVHHIILYSADRNDALAEDSAENGPGWTCFGGPRTTAPIMLGGWVPGTPPTEYPVGTGIQLQASRVIVMQLHYNLANGPPLEDLTTVKLRYESSVSSPAIILPLLDNQFVIPPNSTDQSTTASQTLLTGGKVWGVLPHMHQKGTKIKVELDNSCLIDIPQWNFGWQQFYFYPSPVSFSLGARVQLTCTWNNFTNQEVRWGESTDDEMCLNYFYLTR
ncbi:MAG: hypothetical protein ACOZIN_16110 [Myxococcota bacterium]